MTSAKLLLRLLTFLSVLFLFGVMAVTAAIFHYSKDLPDHHQLANYNPETITRLYAADGQMLAEYANEKRLYVPIDAIPKRLIHAFIAAEDKNFYNHPGIDVVSIFRAALSNALHYGSNKSLVGGSTITQQVVKNFLLTNERSLKRKVREAILAFRITQRYSKDRILELYLNQIYLGNRSYGVAAAALNYFNKSIGELSIEEAAILASLPKAPSYLDPNRYPERALERRNWVIKRMVEEGYISDEEAQEALTKPITLKRMPQTNLVNAGFFTDSVKQTLVDLYTEQTVLTEGLAVRTTLDPSMQAYAEAALMKGIAQYDRRHGYRGPIRQIALDDDNWREHFETIVNSTDSGIWELAVVTATSTNQATIELEKDQTGIIPLEQMSWARRFISRNHIGAGIKSVTDVVKPGDVIAVRYLKTNQGKAIYALEQLPEINGAMVAIDPYTGRVLAMVGGYYYGKSQFNRATQAYRQPGSAFKPFVYLSALENGFTPNSIIVDEEIQFDQGPGLKVWRPQNYTNEYYGATTLRVGVEKSRNVMTVRLAQQLGIDKIIETTKKLNINADPARNLAMVLGSAETTVLQLTTAYAALVNGGKKITPSLIERIQDRNGKTIFSRDNRACPDCRILPEQQHTNDSIVPPFVEDHRESIVDPIAAYQMVSILEGVVQRGTATQAQSLQRTIAGKTGTTNDSFDSWFVGFTPDLVVGVYAGFDNPSSLGNHEYGATIALPIWVDFMEKALANKPDIPFRRPEGVKLVKIDINTGTLPSSSTPPKDIIFEAFRAGTEPSSYSTSPSPNTPRSVDPLDSGTIY